jgi:fructose-1,6-bisphosphatase I
MTLERFIHEQEHLHPSATGEFSELLHDLSVAAKLVWREVSKAGLVNILGSTGRINASGDTVKKLDEFADETIYPGNGFQRSPLRYGVGRKRRYTSNS